MKVRRIIVDPEKLLSFFLMRSRHETNLPSDSKFLNSGYDTALGRGRHKIVLLIWSEHFEPVKDGEIIPEFEVSIRET